MGRICNEGLARWREEGFVEGPAGRTDDTGPAMAGRRCEPPA